jgi:hypothetical protein
MFAARRAAQRGVRFNSTSAASTDKTVVTSLLAANLGLAGYIAFSQYQFRQQQQKIGD